MKKVLIGILLCLAATQVKSADETLGTTSQGDSIVTLTIVDQVKISNVQDIVLGSYSGSGDLSGASQYCVYRNGGDNYTIQVSTTTGNLELVSSTSGDSVPFTLKIDDDLDATDGETLSESDTSGNLVGSSSITCGGFNNGSIRIQLLEANMQSVTSASDYTNTITLLVTPT